MRVQTVCFEFISDGCSLVQFWGAEKSPRLCYVPLAAVWIEAVDRSRIRCFQCLSHLCLVFIRCCSLLLDFSSTAARCSGDFSSTFAAPLQASSPAHRRYPVGRRCSRLHPLGRLATYFSSRARSSPTKLAPARSSFVPSPLRRVPSAPSSPARRSPCAQLRFSARRPLCFFLRCVLLPSAGHLSARLLPAVRAGALRLPRRVPAKPQLGFPFPRRGLCRSLLLPRVPGVVRARSWTQFGAHPAMERSFSAPSCPFLRAGFSSSAMVAVRPSPSRSSLRTACPSSCARSCARPVVELPCAHVLPPCSAPHLLGFSPAAMVALAQSLVAPSRSFLPARLRLPFPVLAFSIISCLYSISSSSAVSSFFTG